ncbi:membrane protein [Alicyclobacillus hesperidum subsp. aegles]|uniref:hypothetical protein n=1 Tax=Alicyclobacillus hesperidum TaxID=89784 RepID=UPI00222C5931|nr:hypothetical protein [Alicyclobacillus hesperidum]GLG02791.1 membrane protein [Alicyclobacillus hesperidum subsp. aegles]
MQTSAGAPVMGGISTSQSPPFAVPIRYMLLGVICFGLFAVDFAFQSLTFARGVPGTPNVVALTHALTLGALLSFVMGAVYQLTTVAFLIPIASVTVARWNFWIYLIGVVGLFTSMSRWWPLGLLVFGFVTVISLYLYCAVMLTSLVKTKARGPMFGFVLSAHVYLILAVSVAVLLVLADSGFVPALNLAIGQLIATHIVLAAGGFFTFLILGFSLKLLPMFTLAHGFSTWRQKWTLRLAHVSVWVIIAAIWVAIPILFWLGVICGLLTLIIHLWDMKDIIKNRMRKKVEWPIWGVVSAVVMGSFGLCLFLLRLFWRGGEAGWQIIVMFYMLGVVTMTVMGFAYKIVPFLIWTKRHSRAQATRQGKPILISDLIDVRRSRPVFIGLIAGIIAGTTAASVSWAPGVIGGCMVIGLAIVMFSVQMLRVLKLPTLRKELFRHD